jgi:hypothetical protein
MTTLALVVASAASSYKVNIFEKSTLNGKELTPGEYKVQIKDNVAVLTQGKTVTEVPVKVVATDTKNRTSSVKYVDGTIKEMRLEGTNKKLVFGEAASTN